MAAVAGRLANSASGVRTLFSFPLSSFSLGSVGLEVQVPSTTNWRGVRMSVNQQNKFRDEAR